MKCVDKKCPICGAINKGLYLEETGGWFECEKCGSETKDLSDEEFVGVPFYTTKELMKQPFITAKDLVANIVKNKL